MSVLAVVEAPKVAGRITSAVYDYPSRETRDRATIHRSEVCQAQVERGLHGSSGNNAEHHQCYIVVLGSASSERLRGGQDSDHRFKSRQPVAGFGELNQSIFAPLFVG